MQHAITAPRCPIPCSIDSSLVYSSLVYQSLFKFSPITISRHTYAALIVQVKFAADGYYLYSGARRDRQLICWDARYTSAAVYSLQRDAQGTNQRVMFDITPMGRHLFSGDQSGQVKVSRWAVLDRSTGHTW